MSTGDAGRDPEDYGLVAGDDEQGVTERSGADPRGADYGLVPDRDDVDAGVGPERSRSGGRQGGDEDYGLVPSTTDTDQLDAERSATDGEDAPVTAAYDGTTVDHGSTPGQSGSGHKGR